MVAGLAEAGPGSPTPATDAASLPLGVAPRIFTSARSAASLLAVNVILHFTDPHFNKASFGFIAKTATALHADVCISGDLLDASRGASFRLARQIEWVRSWVLDQPFKLFL